MPMLERTPPKRIYNLPLPNPTPSQQQQQPFSTATIASPASRLAHRLSAAQPLSSSINSQPSESTSSPRQQQPAPAPLASTSPIRPLSPFPQHQQQDTAAAAPRTSLGAAGERPTSTLGAVIGAAVTVFRRSTGIPSPLSSSQEQPQQQPQPSSSPSPTTTTTASNEVAAAAAAQE
ncbi:hypothetical protein CF326_g8085, partial [Tilletia indica]